jgi:hypothetical protein
MKKSLGLIVVSAAILLPSLSVAGDALQSDPTHHKLEFQNNCVRVIRANFGPGEKSEDLFDAKAVVVVALSGSKGSRLHLPDGKYVDLPGNAPGETYWAPAGRIGVENTTDTRVEFLVIEPQTGCNN